MSRLNKIISDFPVSLTEAEVAALSQTLSAVETAGGGGSEGKSYNGDETTIVLNKTQNTFSLHQNYIDAVAGIPHTVAELTDSANYELATHASNTYLTQTSAANNLAPISVTADVNTLKAASSDWDKVSDKLDSTAAAQTYLTKSDAASTYTTESYVQGYTSGKDAIATALNAKQNNIAFTYTTAEGDNKKYLASLAADNETYYIGEAGGGGGVITYSGRDGIVVSDNGVGLSANYLSAVQAVSGKADKPVTAANKIYAWSTTGTDNGWRDISEIFATRSEIAGYVELDELKTPGTGLTGGYTYEGGYNVGLDAGYKTAIESVSSMSSNAEIASALDLKQDALVFKGLNTGALTSINGSGFAIPDLPHITILPGPYITASEGTGSDAGKWTVGINATGKTYLDSVSSKVDKPATANKNFIYTTSGSTSGWVDGDNIYAKTADLAGYMTTADVTISTATNQITVLPNDSTYSAKISAVSYTTNTADANLTPQKLFVVHNDADLIAHVAAGYCSGQGSLFFVMSGFNS